MSKNRKILLMIVLLITILAASIITAAGSNPWFLLGKNSLKYEKDRDVIIAKVGNTKITKEDIEMQILFNKFQKEVLNRKLSELQNSNLNINSFLSVDVSRKDILNKLIDEAILYEEAQRQGLNVTYDDAKKFMENTRYIMNAIAKGELKCENQKEAMEEIYNFKAYIKGLGMSEDEYWNEIIVYYQKILSIGNLKNKIISPMSEKDKNDINKVNEFFEKYKNELRKKYKIEILDGKFLQQ